MNTERKQTLIQTIKTVLAELAGSDLSGVDPKATFFELGFDSLLLTQAAAMLKNKLQIQISFRQLLDQLTTIEAIADYADQKLPASGLPAEPVKKAAPAPAPAARSVASVASPAPAAKPAALPPQSISAPAPVPSLNAPMIQGTGQSPILERVMKEQLALMAKQLEMLRQASSGSATSPEAAPPKSVSPEPSAAPSVSETPAVPSAASQPAVEPKSFGPYRPINTSTTPEFTAEQQKALDDLIRRYTAKTPTSKKQTQEARAYFADPRSVAGFRTFWKEMVYPIVTDRSRGARFWDVDGNEFIDVTMGFGTNLLGHLPLFVESAIAEQLKKGIEVGPQSPLAGKAAKLMCELTGHERAAFCNTGSEAVLAAIRVARTVTGRTRIATFTGAFHGICDEVLVRGNVVGGKRVSMPIAPGIPRNAVSEVLVLEYGTQESLNILKEHMSELALVLVEPVQSRHPDLQPGEFLRQLRRITAEHDTPLLFDEVITGFRCHIKGAQEYFGVKADLASWGKVIAGGMPVGALTGSAKYMDALDGGFWQYGDNSFPEVGVTFFAGTYVRHPLTMAACCAVLNHLKEQGPQLQERLTARAEIFAAELRVFLKERAVPLNFEQFTSIFYFHFGPEVKHGSLFWFYLRDKGIHFWENRPGFFSTAHSDADIAYFLQAIKETIVEMQSVGFLPPPPAGVSPFQATLAFPKLGDAASPAVPPPMATVRPAAKNMPAAKPGTSGKTIGFGVYFFGNYGAEYRPDKYRVIIEAARFADQNGFVGIWIPERHFHPVGGFSANPSIIAAALARETKQLKLRAGSVVLPLHHPVRVAEEWAMVDNLSEGRVGISIASGWHPHDFVFAPESFDRRRELCREGWEIIDKLWQGQEIAFPTGNKGTVNVKLHPLPKQAKLPVWLTCIHKESYIKAGELGMGVLGYTMNTTLAELTEKIRLYREAFAKAGHDPRQANVTILLHTFVGPTRDVAREIARRPFREYLRSYLDNSSKRIRSQEGAVPIDQEDIEFLLDRAFDDYVNGKSLIGSPESCAQVVAELKKIGVDEIGCFLDFGVSDELVLSHLPHLLELQRLCNSGEAEPETVPVIPPVVEKPAGPRTIDLPEAQKGLVAIAALGKDACRTYTEGNTLDLRGPLDIAALRRALQRCLDRHEALRTALAADGQSQIIYPDVALEVPLEDFSGLAEETQSARLQELFRDMESVPADLSRAPGLRTKIVKLAESHHLLLVFFHHSTGNGPSYWIFFEDLCAFYEEECGGARSTRPEPMQFSAYVDWRRERATSPEYAAAEAFWVNQFAGGLPILELPTDRPRPELKSYLGGRVVLRLDASLTRRIRQAGASLKCSLYMTLLTAYKTLMHRLSGQDDLVVATPFDSEVRSLPGGEGLFANTTNMTLLRSRIESQTTFADLLAATRNQILECREHQDFFFGSLAQKLGLRAGSGKSVLFSVSFNYESGKFERQAGGVKVEYLTDNVPYRCPKDSALADLNLNVAEQNGELVCECDYDAELFNGSTVARMLDQWKILLEGIIAEPGRRLCEIPLMTESERNKILVDWNRTELDYPRNRCLHELFEDQALRQPEAIALVHQDQRLTYRELDERANRLAHQLQTLGVAPGKLVAICAERSLEMIVGLFAILKAGGAYVPLDPNYPKDRLEVMINDARPQVLLTQSALRDLLPPQAATVIDLDDLQNVPVEASAPLEGGLKADGNSLAYVLYTSGSTGIPKGVAIEHHSAVSFAFWARQVFTDAELSGVLFATSICFDLSIFELFATLANGGKVILAKNALELPSLPAANEVKLVNTVPSAIAELVRSEAIPKSVITVNLAGEPLPQSLVEKLYEHPSIQKVYDLYGPTEATTYSTFTLRERGGRATIGRPVGNTQVYILDAHLQPVPAEVAGELHIGGAGLARGYLHRPELTAQKFIPNPFSTETGARMYKTGDLARFLPDGTIEYLGRLDHQVKVRGFRIELGEIEAVLTKHPAVDETVVVVREDRPGLKALVAYVTPKTQGAANGHGSPDELTVQWETQWNRIYETALTGVEDQSEALKNIDSLINRDTNLENVNEHSREWIETTLESILKLKPRRVLEAGCGTGQLLLRIAPQVETYWGSDFALSAVDRLREEVARKQFTGVRLFHSPADQFTEIPPARFDLFIFNSVSQYLPDPDYLVRVLEGAAKTIAPGGRMYIGDVQSRTLLECYHAGSQFKAAPPELPAGELSQRVQQRVNLEAELVVDPEFFHAIRKRIPQITAVDIQLRRGRMVNETTQYHYDVVLTVGGAPKILPVNWQDWKEAHLDESALRRLLEESKPDVLGLRGIPNARLLPDIGVLSAIKSAGSDQTVAQIRGALKPVAGIDPETLWKLAESLGYHLDVRWQGSGLYGKIDVVFSRPEVRGPMCVTDFGDVPVDLKAPVAYANNPVRSLLAGKLPPVLIEHVKSRLPEHMVPTTVVVLEEFPRTPNGKVDRKALPAPVLGFRLEGREFLAPRNEKEAALAEIWGRLLGLEKVSVRDSFFELGGDSLIGFRAVNRANQAGLAVNLRMLFQHKTIADIIKALESDGTSAAVPARPAVTRASREAHKRKLQTLN